MQDDLVVTAKTANTAFRTGLIGTRQVEKEEMIAALEKDDTFQTPVSKASPNKSWLTPPWERKKQAPTPVPTNVTPAVAPPISGAGSLASFMFQSIKSMGRAAKITGAIVDDVQGLVEKVEKSQACFLRALNSVSQFCNYA